MMRFAVIALALFVGGCATEGKALQREIEVREITKSPVASSYDGVIEGRGKVRDSVRYITASTLRRLGMDHWANTFDSLGGFAEADIMRRIDEVRTFEISHREVKFTANVSSSLDSIFFGLVISF